MSKIPKSLKPQLELRDRLNDEIARLQARLEGVEMAIRAVTGEGGASVSARRTPRSSIKTRVLDMLEEVGATGLTANTVVDVAYKRDGERIEKTSVSSQLSRLKSQDVIVLEDSVYKLTKFAKSKEAQPPAEKSAEVHTFKPVSGVFG
ncbi:MAG: hypothetical protein VYD87_14335 [Pseudomonadota bacterium]|nr:hypothetical protein [Pseudomonadota bacterium]